MEPKFNWLAKQGNSPLHSTYPNTDNVRQVFDEYNGSGLGLQPSSLQAALTACGRSYSAAQLAKWTQEINNSQDGRVGLQLFRDFVAFREDPSPVRVPVYTAPVYTAPIRTHRTFIGQPPSVDPNLLREYTHGGHSFDNGHGFRSAMTELEKLEEQDELRIRNIMGGLQGMGQGQFTGAPEILRKMVDYCQQMRMEHDQFVRQNEAVNDQNRELIALCTEMDERLRRANYIIDNHQDYYSQYQTEKDLHRQADEELLKMIDLNEKLQIDNNGLTYDNKVLKDEAVEQKEKIVELQNLLTISARKCGRAQFENDHTTKQMTELMNHYTATQAKSKSTYDNVQFSIDSLVDCAQKDDPYNGFKYIIEIDAKLLAVQIKQIQYLQDHPNEDEVDSDVQSNIQVLININWQNLRDYYFTNVKGANNETYPLLTDNEDKKDATSRFVEAIKLLL